MTTALAEAGHSYILLTLVAIEQVVRGMWRRGLVIHLFVKRGSSQENEGSCANYCFVLQSRKNAKIKSPFESHSLISHPKSLTNTLSVHAE